jgi:hypothetical protein
MTEGSRPIRRHAAINRRTVGSRQISAENFQGLLKALIAKGIDQWSEFMVARFGHDDTLLYPVDQVSEAIRDNDVSRIAGRGAKQSRIHQR